MELIQDRELSLVHIPELWMFNSCCLTDVLTGQAAETSNYASNYKIQLELAEYLLELEVKLDRTSN